MATKASATFARETSPATATRARYVAVAYGMTLSFITFLHRAAIGQAAPLIRRDLGLTAVEMGYVFSAFGLAYALLEIPAGMYGDWKGPRKVLTQIAVVWSALTIATGWAWNFASLWAIRLLFGAAEAGCYPGLARMFKTWLPVRERPVAEGLKAASARLGAAVAPLLVVFLYTFMSWKNVFLVFGLVGFAWAAAFYWWFRDTPSEHASVNAAELAIIRSRTRGMVTGCALEPLPCFPQSLDALHPVVLPFLRVLLLHHVAFDLSAGSSRSGYHAERRLGRVPAADGRPGQPGRGLVHLRPDSPFRCTARAQAGLLRFLRGRGDPDAFGDPGRFRHGSHRVNEPLQFFR